MVRRRTTFAAWIAICAPLGGIATITDVTWLRLAAGGLALAGTVVVAFLITREGRHEARDDRRAESRQRQRDFLVDWLPVASILPTTSGCLWRRRS
jgi:hypothetical protein